MVEKEVQTQIELKLLCTFKFEYGITYKITKIINDLFIKYPEGKETPYN